MSYVPKSTLSKKNKKSSLLLEIWNPKISHIMGFPNFESINIEKSCRIL